MLHLLAGGRFNTEPQVRRVTVRAADAELLHFETAARFDYLVEDLLHDVGIDQVAFGLDDFFKWHETTSLPGTYGCAACGGETWYRAASLYATLRARGGKLKKHVKNRRIGHFFALHRSRRSV
jgi:hypothetical protein